MSTTIEWTQRPGTKGETWNPTTGCNKVSQGCKHCYAEIMHRRLKAMGVKGYEHDFLDGARPQPHTLDRPLKWKKPRTVFVNSMSDLFHEAVPFSYIDQVFAVMALCPQHTFLILTKRPERMAEYCTKHCGRLADVIITKRRANGDTGVVIPLPDVAPGAAWWPLPNVWLGTSVEEPPAADSRIPHLLRCPAAVRFLSCEPLLGPVDIQLDLSWATDDTGKSVDWVIAGGESGHGARPMNPDWARGLRDQCEAAGVPFFFKQVGGPDKKAAGRLLDGREWNEWPKVHETEKT